MRFELALYGLRNLAPGSRVTQAGDIAAAKLGATGLSQPPRSFFVERTVAAAVPAQLARLA